MPALAIGKADLAALVEITADSIRRAYESRLRRSRANPARRRLSSPQTFFRDGSGGRR